MSIAGTVEPDDNQNSDHVPFETLEQAFGPSSLGIIVVSGLPPEFPALREAVLGSASHLPSLPTSTLGERHAPSPEASAPRPEVFVPTLYPVIARDAR